MTEAAREFDDELTLAVDVMVEAYGVVGAEQELQDRFSASDATGYETEALAYLRRNYEDQL